VKSDLTAVQLTSSVRFLLVAELKVIEEISSLKIQNVNNVRQNICGGDETSL
jgi:hypothetical protein